MDPCVNTQPPLPRHGGVSGYSSSLCSSCEGWGGSAGLEQGDMRARLPGFSTLPLWGYGLITGGRGWHGAGGQTPGLSREVGPSRTAGWYQA